MKGLINETVSFLLAVILAVLFLMLIAVLMVGLLKWVSLLFVIFGM